MKRFYWLILGPLSVIVVVYFSLKAFIFPLLTDFANNKLLELSEKNNYVKIKFEKIDFHVFDPNIEVLNIEFQSKKELKSVFQEAKIKKVNLKIDLFQLILGKLNFNLLEIKDVQAQVNLDPLLEGDGGSKEIPIEKLYLTLNKIPIQRFKFDQLNIEINSLKNNKVIKFNDALIRTSYLENRFFLKLSMKNNFMKDLSKSVIVPFESEINLLFYKAQIDVREFTFKMDNNQLSVDGRIDNVKKLLLHPEVFLNTKSHIDLEKIKKNLTDTNLYIFPEKISGVLDLEGKIALNGIKNIEGFIQLHTSSLSYSHFELGSAKIQSEFKKDLMKISKIEIKHSSGKVNIDSSQIKITEPYEFQTHVSSEKFNIQSLFQTLSLKEIPVFLNVTPNLQCQGQIRQFGLNCKGTVGGTDIKILSSAASKSAPIVEVQSMEAKGSFNVDSEKIAFDSDVSIMSSHGRTHGEVIFNKGFNIQFLTPELDFKNIRSFIGLDFDGKLAIDGWTMGNSKYAIFEMNTNVKGFELEKYRLGDFSSQLYYENGILKFNKINGKMISSPFQGDVKLNLPDLQISGNLGFTNSKLSELTQIFNQIIPVPFNLEGLGSANIDFHGPLNFWKLNYKLNAKFTNGYIHTESFNNFLFNVNAENGNAVLDGTKLEKNKSEIIVTGKLLAEKSFNIRLNSSLFKLEESEFIKSISHQIFGNFQFDSIIEGPVTNPQFSTKVKIFDNTLGDKLVEPSTMNILLKKDFISFNNDIFGQKLKMKLRWPFHDHGGPFEWSSQFYNFDLTDLFPLIGAGNLQSDYVALMTADAKLNSSNSELNDLSGEINLERLFFQKNLLFMNLQESTKVTAKNGKFEVKDLTLQGPENLLQISGKDFTLNKLNLEVKSKVDLRLFHFLVPFLEEISGQLELGTKISESIGHPQIIGQANLNNGFVKIKGFPHAFEKVGSNIVFSQSKVFFQSIAGALADGTFSGEGQVEFMGFQKIPLYLKFRGENLKLNVPEKVKSVGRADLVLSGQWFPFLLSGNYFISDGIFEKEFGEEESIQTTKQSIYLPKKLKEQNFQPLTLDILLNLEKKFAIKNSQMDGFINGNIQVKGPIGNTVLLGKMDIEKKSKLYFKDKIFELQTGLVNFNNPVEINPELYITATSRVNDYDINFILQGPAKSSAIKMTSVPPLPENEIISLLALGVTSSKLEQNVQSKDQAAQTGYEIGAAVLSQSAITKNIKNKLGLDIQFVNTFDSTKNISVLKATASKKITNKIHATASRSLGNEGNTEVKLQYLFNQNVSAVGNWQGRETESVNTNDRESQSVFGLDLEFKKEFK